MKYAIAGALINSGDEVEIVVDAGSEVDARSRAAKMGIAVAEVHGVQSPQSPPATEVGPLKMLLYCVAGIFILGGFWIIGESIFTSSGRQALEAREFLASRLSDDVTKSPAYITAQESKRLRRQIEEPVTGLLSVLCGAVFGVWGCLHGNGRVRQ